MPKTPTEQEADAALRERIAEAKLAPAPAPEPEVTPELTVMEQFQRAIISCRNLEDAIKIAPGFVAEVERLLKTSKAPIPYYFFGGVRAICADCGWIAGMTWSELALEIGQAARRARREELLAQVES